MQQESMDSIIVLLRIRPFNERERQDEAQPCFKIDDHSKNTVIFEGSSKGEARYFTFDHVCPEQIHQEEIFRIVGIPTARSCLQGYNGCIFAYGQTGAGKTYTIQGQSLDINVTESLPLEVKEKVGLLPRVVDYMFSDIVSAHDTSSSIAYSVKCSYLEIYNEHIIDLLNPSVKNLQVREDLKRGVHVEGITEEICSNATETMDLLKKGNRNRHIGSTNLNIESSRSHSVFTFTVEGKVTQDGITRIRTSQFSFVDLAGSERQKVVGTAGERLKEGSLINKSLMVLASVINSLVDISEGKSRFVHYRDSKLTFLLKYSLGGNAKTSVIANISPASTSYMETLSTLKFAQRAKLIKNKVRINEDTSGTLESLKNEIFRLRQELATMRSIINIGGIKYEDYKRDPNRLGFESDQGSDMLSNRFPYESLDNQEMRDSQKNNELERLLKQSLEILKESETHLLSELSKKEDVIGQLENAHETSGKNELQMKMVIKLLYDKVERYKAMLAKKILTGKDCIGVIEEEQRNDLRQRIVQVLKEPQTDLQKSQMKELEETREENIRIKQEYKKLLELLTQKDGEIAMLIGENEKMAANLTKAQKPKKAGQGKAEKGSKGAVDSGIKEEYDELVKEYMNLCEKMEDREQDVEQMRQDFENLEAEKKEMMENLSKELVQIKKDYHKKLEKIVKEKERRLDQIKEDFMNLNNERDGLQNLVNSLTEEKGGLSKKVEELKARINQSNQEKLSNMSKSEENKQKEIGKLSEETLELQEKLRKVTEENKVVKNENRKIVEEYENACKEIKTDYEKIKEEGRRATNELQEMQALYDDLQQQLVEKEDENQDLAASLEELRKELEKKEQLIPTLKQSFDGINKEFSDKTKEVENIRNEFEKLKDEKFNNEEEFRKLQRDHERLLSQHSYLKQEEAALQEELKIVQHKLDCEIQETRHIKTEYDKLNNTFRNKEQDHGGLQNKLWEKDEEIKNVREEYEQQLQELENLYEEIKKDSDIKTQEILNIQKDYEISQKNLIELRRSMEDLGRTRNEYNSLQEDYFTREREIENLRGEIEDLRARRNQDLQRIEDLTRECKNLEKKVMKGSDEMRGLEKECDMYRSQKLGINQELSALARQYQDTHNENRAKQQEIEALEEELWKMKEKYIVAEENCDRATRDCQDWEAKYELKEEDFARLKLEAENLRRSILEQDDGYETLRSQLDVMQSESIKNRLMIDSLRTENEQFITEIERLSAERSKDEEELNELRKERNRLKTERKRLMSELEEYQLEDTRLREQMQLRVKTIANLEERLVFSPEKEKRRASQGAKRVITQMDLVLEEMAVRDRKLRNIEERIHSLTEELAEKSEEINIKEMIIRDKDDRISSQAKELQHKDEEVYLKEQETFRLREEYKIVLNEKNLMDAAEKTLRNEVVKLSEEVFKATTKKKEEKAEMKSAQKEIEHENRRLTSLLKKQEDEMVNLRREFNKLEGEIEVLNISKAEWMERKTNMDRLEELNQENYNKLRDQHVKLAEKYEKMERDLVSKYEEIGQLKQDCNTLIDERDKLQEKVENLKGSESKLKKDVQEYSINITRLQEGQEREIQEMKDNYSRLHSDHKNAKRNSDSKDAHVIRLKEELRHIASEKERLLDEVKGLTNRDAYRSRSKNERESYTSRFEEYSLGHEAVSERHHSAQKYRYTSRAREDPDSKNTSLIKNNDKERSYFRGSYSNQKEPEYLRVESGRKNADNSGILKVFPRDSVTDFLTPQKERPSLNASRDMDSSFNGLSRVRGTKSREREPDIETSMIQNSIMEKEALLIKQRIYLGQPISSVFMEGESQHSNFTSKSRSQMPTPIKNSGNNESFSKYSDSKINYASGKSPILKRLEQDSTHEDHFKDSTADSYRRLAFLTGKSSPIKKA